MRELRAYPWPDSVRDVPSGLELVPSCRSPPRSMQGYRHHSTRSSPRRPGTCRRSRSLLPKEAPPKEALPSLDGEWRDASGLIGLVRASTLEWAHPVDEESATTRLQQDTSDGTSVWMDFLGERIFGCLEGDQLQWATGDVWRRGAPPPAEPPPAAPQIASPDSKVLPAVDVQVAWDTDAIKNAADNTSCPETNQPSHAWENTDSQGPGGIPADEILPPPPPPPRRRMLPQQPCGPAPPPPQETQRAESQTSPAEKEPSSPSTRRPPPEDGPSAPPLGLPVSLPTAMTRSLSMRPSPYVSGRAPAVRRSESLGGVDLYWRSSPSTLCMLDDEHDQAPGRRRQCLMNGVPACGQMGQLLGGSAAPGSPTRSYSRSRGSRAAVGSSPVVQLKPPECQEEHPEWPTLAAATCSVPPAGFSDSTSPVEAVGCIPSTSSAASHSGCCDSSSTDGANCRIPSGSTACSAVDGGNDPAVPEAACVVASRAFLAPQWTGDVPDIAFNWRLTSSHEPDRMVTSSVSSSGSNAPCEDPVDARGGRRFRPLHELEADFARRH